MSILLFCLVVALVAVILIWLVDQVGLPAPINMVVKAIIVLIAIVAIVQQLNIDI